MAVTEIVVTGATPPTPGLLVSVRSAREAIAAVDGGADFIDVKEPENGPLGAASLPTVESIVQAVAGRRPVTVALGELVEGPFAELALPGVAVAKVGLAGSIGIDLAAELSELGRRLPGKTVLAAAAYVDHEQAESPDPEAVLEAVRVSDCHWLVLDTYDKSGPSSLSLMPPERLSPWIAGATARGVRVVLAGRIGKDDLATAAACRPWLIGVRGAACVAGRASQIAEDRVRSLAQCLAGCGSNQ